MDEILKHSQKDEVKKEKKLIGDSGYDCNYCHGKKHLAKECMLRRMSEKKDEENDEAYHLRKIEKIRKKKSVGTSKLA